MKGHFLKREVSTVDAYKLENPHYAFVALSSTFSARFSIHGHRFELLYNVVIVAPSPGWNACLECLHEAEVLESLSPSDENILLLPI